MPGLVTKGSQMHQVIHVSVGIAALCATVCAYGALGEKYTSVTTDQVKLKATLASTARASYTDHVMTQDSGLIVHEYAGSDTTVFAVAWQGPVMPNLEQLLGTYFSNFVAARQSQSSPVGGVSQFHSQQTDLVIHSSGRLGAFSGIIYVPSLVPSGVDAEALQ